MTIPDPPNMRYSKKFLMQYLATCFSCECKWTSLHLQCNVLVDEDTTSLATSVKENRELLVKTFWRRLGAL